MPILDVVTSGTSPPGTTVLSPPSITASALMPTDRWWLIDPENPINNITINVKNQTLPITASETQAQHFVLGSKFITFIADSLKGDVFTLEVDFLDDPSWQAFVKLRNMAKTLLLQAPYNQQWYIRIGSDVTPTLQNTATLYRDTTFSVSEQARP